MRNFISSHKILFYSTKFDTEVRKVVLKSAKYIKIYSYNLLFHFKFTREEAEVQKAISLIKRNLIFNTQMRFQSH